MIDYLQAELDRLDQKIAEAQTSLSDPQLAQLAEEEIKALNAQKQSLVDSQNQPSKEADDESEVEETFPSITIEVRSAAGGEEAKLWASDLIEMYTRYATAKNLPVTVLDSNVIKIKGKTAYPIFKWESGVHRVQRVPQTEAQGRIHTSTATVAVLPEIKETDISIHPNDIELVFYRSSGAGGQNVNKVSTAVRLKHIPSGIIIESQTQRFQDQNRKIALDLLRSKLWEAEQVKKLAQIGTTRQQAVGKGDRSEKIRTYNFPQNRVTDHRIGKSYKSLDRMLQGDLDPLIEDLLANL